MSLDIINTDNGSAMYMGKRVRDMTKDELIEALAQMNGLYEREADMNGTLQRMIIEHVKPKNIFERIFNL